MFVSQANSQKDLLSSLKPNRLFLLLSALLSLHIGSVSQASNCHEIFSADASALTQRLRERLAKLEGESSLTASETGGRTTTTSTAVGQLRAQASRILELYFKDGITSYQTVDQLADSLKNQPEEIQSIYVEETLGMYRRLSKKSFETDRLPSLSPRRLADRLLFQLYRGDLRIIDSIQNGLTPELAYQAYLESMSKSSKAGYGFKEVKEVLLLFQRILKELPKNAEGDSLKTGDYFTVGGSFFNGRADLSRSDVDVSAWNEKWERAFAGGTRQIELNAIFKIRGHKGVDLAYEFHRLSDHFYGLIQPVAFRIFRDRIELLLYAPPGRDDRDVYRINQLNFRPTVVHMFEIEP